MLDIKFIRENPEVVKKACKDKNVGISVDLVLDLDKEKRALMTEIETLKAEQNKITLETTDSVNGAVNIYIQDLFNRYPNYKLTKQDITKTGALDNKGVLISLSGKTGALKITIWGTDKGMTDIEIIKDSNFK